MLRRMTIHGPDPATRQDLRLAEELAGARVMARLARIEREALEGPPLPPVPRSQYVPPPRHRAHRLRR